MSKMFLRSVLAASTLALVGVALAATSPAKVATTAKGPALVNQSGMTLYTFAKDTKDMSACNGPCAGNWPPLAAKMGETGPKGWSVFKRADGTAQWAYHGKPLYTFVKDTKAGDTMGDGFLKGAWHIAKP